MSRSNHPSESNELQSSPKPPPACLTDSPNLRKELLTWLASKLPYYKSFSTEEALSLIQPIHRLSPGQNSGGSQGSSRNSWSTCRGMVACMNSREGASKCNPNIWSTIQPFVDSYKPVEFCLHPNHPSPQSIYP